MPHAVLLGDSIFDNGAYVAGGTPLVDQLRSRLPRDWKVTLLACDGAFVRGVLAQLEKLPADATHLIVSAGGNDALVCVPVLNYPKPNPHDLLQDLVQIQKEFRMDYAQMLSAVQRRRLPVIACTVYDAVPDLEDVARMGLSLFNDVIVRELSSARIPILDLRRVCNEVRDYAEISPIEPSEIGGSKIARALQHILLDHDFMCPQSLIYP